MRLADQRSEEPLVSIAMPVFNSSETIYSAIRSILEQTYPNWELIIVDDGSTDDSIRIVEGFSDSRIRILSIGLHRGIVACLNEAIDVCKGMYFARMDSDDISYPQRVERQVAYLTRNPNIDLIGTNVLVFGSNGRPFGKRSLPEEHDEICAKPIAGFPIQHPTYLGKTEWFRQYKYNEYAKRCEDQDLLLRSYRFSQFAIIPEILLGYREEKIDLRKLFRGRYFFSKIIKREFGQSLLLSTRGVVEQAMKGTVELFAILSGLDYSILRHRARQISEDERHEWAKIWQLVNRVQESRG